MPVTWLDKQQKASGMVIEPQVMVSGFLVPDVFPIMKSKPAYASVDSRMFYFQSNQNSFLRKYHQLA